MYKRDPKNFRFHKPYDCIFSVFLGLFFWACDKNKKVIDYEIPPSIQETMIINSKELIADKSDLALDLNNDAVNDIYFKYERLHVMDSDYRNCYKIQCADTGVKLAGFFKTDTLFHSKTLKGPYRNTANNIEYYITSIYRYKKISDTDSLLQIWDNNFKLNYYRSSALFDTEPVFKSDTVILREQPHYYHEIVANSDKDTLKLYTTYMYSADIPFPENQIRYIRFKLYSKTGWIKLSMTENYRITVYETAIQR